MNKEKLKTYLEDEIKIIQINTKRDFNLLNLLESIGKMSLIVDLNNAFDLDIDCLKVNNKTLQYNCCCNTFRWDGK